MSIDSQIQRLKEAAKALEDAIRACPHVVKVHYVARHEWMMGDEKPPIVRVSVDVST